MRGGRGRARPAPGAPARRARAARYIGTVSTHPVDTIAELRRAQLFAQLDDEQLAKLAAIARPLHLDAEQDVFLQGDAATPSTCWPRAV